MLPQLAFGFLASIYGGSIYYFLPYSMLSNKLTMLLRLFFVVLLGLLLGLCILAMNVQTVLEIIMAKTLFFWETKIVKVLMLNNLSAHVSRNRFTTTIY
jgi:uncharacterized membrane protein